MSDSKLKLVYMGTAQFAVPSLNKLVSENFDVRLVVTQPDRKKGRGQAVAYSHVKQAALNNGLELFQPESINTKESIDVLNEIAPDVIIVVAYGQILKSDVLNLPAFGCINIHASILPELRGPAPINWSIVNGDSETGVTSMMIDEGMDSGDILQIERMALDDRIDSVTLGKTLSEMGAELLVKTLERIKAKDITPKKQDESAVTIAPKLTKANGEISFNEKSAKQIHDMVRGFKPWPGAFTTYNGKTLKVLSTYYDADYEVGGADPGTVVMVTKESFYIAANSGVLEIKSVQPQNKRAMDAADFINGYGIKAGAKLGE